MKKTMRVRCRRGLAMLLVCTICMGTFAGTAFAAEGGEVNTETGASENTGSTGGSDEKPSGNTESTSGSVEKPTSTTDTKTTVSKDEGTGNTTTTKETTTTWTEGSGDVEKPGSQGNTQINGSETTTEVTETDKDGNVVSEKESVEGKEVTTTTNIVPAENAGPATEQTVTTGAENKVIDGTFGGGEDSGQTETSENIQIGVEDWTALKGGEGNQLPKGEDGKDIEEPIETPMVTMKPGENGGQGWVGLTVDVNGLVEKKLEVQDKLKAPAKPEGAMDYEDFITGIKGYQEKITKEDGKTVTRAVIEFKENEQIVGHQITETDENGNQTITTVKALPGGIGYETTTVVITSEPNGSKKDTEITSETTETITPTGAPSKVTTIDFPQGKPEPREYTDEATGNKVTVTVEELYDMDDEGNIVYDEAGSPIVAGYVTTTTTTNADGTQVSSNQEFVWGLKTITTTTPVVVEGTYTQKVTTTSSILVTRATTMEGRYIEVTDATWNGKGELAHCGIWGKVEVKDNALNAPLETKDLAPDITEPDEGATDTTTDLYHRADKESNITVTPDKGVNVRKGPGTSFDNVGALSKGAQVTISAVQLDAAGNTWGKIGDDQWICLYYKGSGSDYGVFADNKSAKIDKGQFIWIGQYGLESAIRINSAQKGDLEDTWQAHQYEIWDANGDSHYVYCADFSISPKANAIYGEQEITDTNRVWEALYNISAADPNVSEKILAIAANGYWGTTSGMGSLEAVKQMLKDSLHENDPIRELIDGCLTEGVALAATQAAIWSYAASNANKKINVEDPFGKYNTNDSFGDLNADKEKVAKALYEHLRGLTTKSAQLSSEKITKDSIVETSITIKEINADSKKADPNDKVNGIYQYKTDISFVLTVEPSKINDDLLVTIGNQTWRIAGQNSSDQEYGYIKGVRSENGWVYTLSDVMLTENEKVTLKLSGLRVVEKKAYLITAKSNDGYDPNLSQTFVSAKADKQRVDLDIDLQFNVREPSAKLVMTKASKGESKTDISEKILYQKVTKKETKDQVEVKTERKWGNSSGTKYTTTPEIPETPDRPTTPTTTTSRRSRDRSSTTVSDEPTPLAGIADDPTPLAMLPEEQVPLAILDGDVPLASVPATGDISGLWYALSIFAGLSLMGMGALSGKKRKDALDD